jgi:hypothetical protein
MQSLKELQFSLGAARSEQVDTASTIKYTFWFTTLTKVNEAVRKLQTGGYPAYREFSERKKKRQFMVTVSMKKETKDNSVIGDWYNDITRASAVGARDTLEQHTKFGKDTPDIIVEIPFLTYKIVDRPLSPGYPIIYFNDGDLKRVTTSSEVTLKDVLKALSPYGFKNADMLNVPIRKKSKNKKQKNDSYGDDSWLDSANV